MALFFFVALDSAIKSTILADVFQCIFADFAFLIEWNGSGFTIQSGALFTC